jgi:hypothetical protein
MPFLAPLCLALAVTAAAAQPPSPSPPCPTPAQTLARVAPAWLALLEGVGAGPLLRGEAPLLARDGLTLLVPTDAALSRGGALNQAWAPGLVNGTGLAGLPLRPGSVASLLAAAPAAGPVLIAAHAVRGARPAAGLVSERRPIPTLATRKLVGRPDERLGIAVEAGGSKPTPLLTSAGGVTAALVGPDAHGGSGCLADGDGAPGGGGPAIAIAIHVIDAVLLPFAPYQGGEGQGG